MHVPRSLVLRLIRSAALLWLGVRLLGLIFGPVPPLPLGIAFFPMVVLAVMWIDIFATGDRVVFGNLGVSPVAVSAITAGVAACLELVLVLVLGVASWWSTGPAA